MGIRIPKDLERLQDELPGALSRCSDAHQWAAAEIVDRLNELWAEHDQGLPVKTVDLLNEELAPVIDAILEAQTPPEQADGVDRLVRAWKRLAGRIETP